MLLLLNINCKTTRKIRAVALGNQYLKELNNYKKALKKYRKEQKQYKKDLKEYQVKMNDYYKNNPGQMA